MPKQAPRGNKYNNEQKEMKKIFAKRLKELRKSKDLSHEKLASELKEKHNLDISKQALINYEVDNEYNTKFYTGFGMNINYLWALAEYFEVSTDYFFGKSSTPTNNEILKIIGDYTGLTEPTIETLKYLKNNIEKRPYTQTLINYLLDEFFYGIDSSLAFESYMKISIKIKNIKKIIHDELGSAYLINNEDVVVSKGKNLLNHPLGKELLKDDETKRFQLFKLIERFKKGIKELDKELLNKEDNENGKHPQN